jgi:hypothetical protein
MTELPVWPIAISPDTSDVNTSYKPTTPRAKFTVSRICRWYSLAVGRINPEDQGVTSSDPHRARILESISTN